MFPGVITSVEFDMRSMSHPSPDSLGDHYWYPDTTVTHYICAHDHRWKTTTGKPCWCGEHP